MNLVLIDDHIIDLSKIEFVEPTEEGCTVYFTRGEYQLHIELTTQEFFEAAKSQSPLLLTEQL
jgi:hypothetical protein